jgi:hypothetical protein
MSTDPKSPKPMPSVDEINAYLELSAARTRLRLPLAKCNAAVVVPDAAASPGVEKNAARALPLSGAKKLPTGREEPSVAAGSKATGQASTADSADAAWRPFPNEGEG